MTDGPNESEPQRAPDWVADTPKPIELPPVAETEAAKPKLLARGGSGRGWLLFALVLLLALVGSSPWWAPALATLLPWTARANDPVAAALTQLEARLGDIAQHQAALDQRFAAVDTALRGTGSLAAAVHELSGRVGTLEERSAALARIEDDMKRLSAAQAQVTSRLAALEARPEAAAADRGDEALLLALGQLRVQAERPQPFAAALGAIEALGHDRPEIRQTLQPLEAAAAKGVATMAMLARQFDETVAPAVLRSAAEPAADAGWGDWALAKLRSLVTLRRVAPGASGGDPVEESVSHAEAALGRGDLADAVNAVAALPARAAPPAQAWLAEARQRLALDQALAKLTDDLAERLTAQTERSGAR